MAQLKVYQIDHYRQKIRDLINPLKRIIDLKLSEKKDIVKQQISKKLRQSLKIEKWKKDIDFQSIDLDNFLLDLKTIKTYHSQIFRD